MLDNIKTLLGIAYDDYSKDSLILLLIEQEKDYALNYTNNTNVLTNQFLISKMIIYRYNTLGTEGIKSENYSGASYSYLEDYPIQIQKDLNNNRKLKVL